MERTNEFLDFVCSVAPSPVRAVPTRKPSVLVEKAVATVRDFTACHCWFTMQSNLYYTYLMQYRQIESFERLLHECRDSFVNYHRY